MDIDIHMVYTVYIIYIIIYIHIVTYCYYLYNPTTIYIYYIDDLYVRRVITMYTKTYLKRMFEQPGIETYQASRHRQLTTFVEP